MIIYRANCLIAHNVIVEILLIHIKIIFDLKLNSIAS